jgi:hypothetical protein
VTNETPRPGVRQSLDDLDQRYVPVAAAVLDRLIVTTDRRLELAPNARRILGALSLVLLGCALALVLIGS